MISTQALLSLQLALLRNLSLPPIYLIADGHTLEHFSQAILILSLHRIREVYRLRFPKDAADFYHFITEPRL